MKTAVSRRTLLRLAAAPALLSRAGVQAQDLEPTASRVSPGGSGSLVYVPDDEGNIIHDASHAGYGGGGVAIPTVPVRETIWLVAGDNTQHIQAAIDRVSGLPRDAAGFRGAVLLRAGYYRMAAPVRIQASGVVLRGEGMGDTGTVLIGTGTGRSEGGQPGGGGAQGTLVVIAGASGATVGENTRHAVVDDYVPVGARRLRVASTRAFGAGDTVIVRRIGNQAWIDAVCAPAPAALTLRSAPRRESAIRIRCGLSAAGR